MGAPVGEGVRLMKNVTRARVLALVACCLLLSWSLSGEGTIQQQQAAAVPEPAYLFLFGTGLAAIAAKLRKRRKAT
jgi:hypothetical protein